VPLRGIFCSRVSCAENGKDCRKLEPKVQSFGDGAVQGGQAPLHVAGCV